MKIAIHPFEKGFNESWVPYLKTNNIDFIIVDCYKTDIISQLDGCTHLVWQWTQHDPLAMILVIKNPEITKKISTPTNPPEK